MSKIVVDEQGNQHIFPDEATPEQITAAMQAASAPPPSGLDEAGRAAGYLGQGINTTVGSALGALPEAISSGARALGLNLAPPGYYTGAIQRGLQAIGMGGPSAPPQTAIERGAAGAGRGIGEAASVMVPAAAIARALPAAGLAQRVVSSLAQQPAAQVAAGAIGGGVGGVTDNPALGTIAALATPAAGALAERAISPALNRLTPEAARLAGVAGAEGIPLTAGQQTGSRALQTVESVLGRLPFSAGMRQTEEQTQRDAFNRAVLSRAGLPGQSAAPDVLQAGRDRLGNEFQQLAGQTTVQMDRPLAQDLVDVSNRYYNKLPSQTRPIFQNYVNDIIRTAHQNGLTIPGSVYQVARSDLGRQAKSLAQSDPTLSQALKGLQGALDDAADRAIPPALRDRWNQARLEYGNLKVVQNAMATPSADVAAGNVPAARLWQGVKAQNGPNIAYGQGDLNDLARIGQAFVKQQIPDSGTAQRAMWQRLLTGSIPAAGVFGAAHTGGGSPLVAGGSALAALMLPPAVQRFMQSAAGRAWLTNQVARGAGPQLDGPLIASILAGRAQEPAAVPFSSSVFGGH